MRKGLILIFGVQRAGLYPHEYGAFVVYVK